MGVKPGLFWCGPNTPASYAVYPESKSHPKDWLF